MDLNEANLGKALNKLRGDETLSHLIDEQAKITEFMNLIAERVVKLENNMDSALDLLRQLHDCSSGRKNFPGVLKFKDDKDNIDFLLRFGVPNNNYWRAHRYMYKVDDKDIKDEDQEPEGVGYE